MQRSYKTERELKTLTARFVRRDIFDGISRRIRRHTKRTSGFLRGPTCLRNVRKKWKIPGSTPVVARHSWTAKSACSNAREERIFRHDRKGKSLPVHAYPLKNERGRFAHPLVEVSKTRSCSLLLFLLRSKKSYPPPPP